MSDENIHETIDIDGNFLEGGGQIVRTALGLSTLTGKPFKVNNIRKGRKVPGLKHQHLSAIRSLQQLCDAKTNKIELGSTELTFEPGALKPRTLGIDIGTAGSITLLLQSLWVPLMLPKAQGDKFRLKIKGGTDTKWSMPLDYMQEVFFPQLQRYADVQMNPIKRGFYPKGGGEIDLKIKGKYSFHTAGEAPKIELGQQGHLIQIKGISHASTLLENAQVAERQAKAAKHLLTKYDVPV
ncbi:RNA 3'-phosphate cyclase, partial [Candidatus Woesearchaeota archaeon]|nr:RNA 3'-phosphate cyclase [Candidatus Woesearchaeota archaeon]